MEAKEEIDSDILEQVAKILHVTPETIQKLNEDAAINIISNTFSDFKDSASASIAPNYHCDLTFNPLELVVRLYDEKVALLERLMQSEREKTEPLKNSKDS